MRIRSLIFARVAVLGVLAGVMAFASVPAQATPVAIGRFGPEGPGSGPFMQPQSIAVEQATGDVYVYELGEDEEEEQGNVYKFNASDQPEDFSSLASDVIEGVGGEAGATQIAIANGGPDAGDLFVDTGASVLIYNATTGAEEGTLTSEEEPCGVAVDPSGNVYVAFFADDTISKYTPATGPVRQSDYTSSLWDVGKTCNIAADSAGDIYAARYSSYGEGVTKYPASEFTVEEENGASQGTVIDSETNPTLAVEPVSGDVYIDQGNTIAEYNSSGTLVEQFGALTNSWGVAVDDTSGDVYTTEGGAEEREVVIFGPASVSVTEDPLTVNITGSGTVACEIEGTGKVEQPCADEYSEATKLVLTAIEGSGYTFAGWSGTGSATACTGTGACLFTIEAATEVTATFSPSATPKDKLTIAKSGTGEVKCKVGSGSFTSCASEYDEGAELTLEGVASPGWTFEGWSGAGGSVPTSCNGTTSNCPATGQFTIASNSTITATFGASAEYTLSVYDVGKGTVTSKPSGINNCGMTCSYVYPYGEKVELKETPETGYEFAGWIGCKGTGSTCEVEGTRETEVAAVFYKQGTQGAKGEKGEPGINGTNGGRGLEGPIGEVGPAGAQGEKGPAGANGTDGKNGAQGPAGPAGAQGPAGPAGEVELVTCKKGKKSVQECTTKLVSGTVKFTAAAASARATLSRHGFVYAAGMARGRHGRMSLRLAPLRKLGPGHYTLTLTSGSGRGERICSEAFTLR